MKLTLCLLLALSAHAQEPARQSADFLDCKKVYCISTLKLELTSPNTNLTITNWSTRSNQPWLTLRNCCNAATRNLTIDFNNGEMLYVSTDGIRIPSPALMKSLLKWQVIVEGISRGL